MCGLSHVRNETCALHRKVVRSEMVFSMEIPSSYYTQQFTQCIQISNLPMQVI